MPELPRLDVTRPTSTRNIGGVTITRDGGTPALEPTKAVHQPVPDVSPADPRVLVRAPVERVGTEAIYIVPRSVILRVIIGQGGAMQRVLVTNNSGNPLRWMVRGNLPSNVYIVNDQGQVPAGGSNSFFVAAKDGRFQDFQGSVLVEFYYVGIISTQILLGTSVPVTVDYV